jgi:hypothetical protein
MDKVTYILGAGFSAPLGLPVMSNFLIKSKDLYFQDTQKYSYFESVFNTIKELSVCKNYYDTNLFNIEEILSILEVKSFIEGKKLKDDFIKYIIESIVYYTPDITPRSKDNFFIWKDKIFGDKELQSLYGYFVGSLFGVSFKTEENKKKHDDDKDVRAKKEHKKTAGYSVISLNYDMVLEKYCDFINTQYITDETIFFKKEFSPSWEEPSLFKLHGCVFEGTIVPPTWAKGTHSEIIPIWNNAYQALVDSTHIRFVGYSLPASDSYIIYLLKSAVVNASHLKQIDVICLDGDGSTINRFGDFIHYCNYRYKDVFVEEYLKKNYHLSMYDESDSTESVILNKLEIAHEEFMSE